MSGAPEPAGPRQHRMFAVYTFDSTHDSLTAEQVLVDAGIAVRAIPKPRTLGGGCGIALRLEPLDALIAEELLHDRHVDWTAKGEIDDY
jgi:hypothetical protein